MLFKFFQYAGYFPRAPQDVPLTVVDHLAQQVGVPTDTWAQYAWDSRTIERHRAQIRQHLGFREATVADGETLVTWLCAQILPTTRRPDHLKEAVAQRCRDLRIEPPTPERLDRLIRSAVHREDTRVGTEILHRLSATTQGQLEALLGPAETPASDSDASAPTLERALLQELGRTRARDLGQPVPGNRQTGTHPGPPAPPTLFDDLAPTVLQAYRQRVAVEEPYELRRHAVPLRMTLLAAFCLLRGRELTDILVDLLELVHRLGAKAERKVEKALVDDLKRVHGKTGMLYRLAEASLDHPTGVVHEVIFPVVSEATLRDLVKEWKATGPSIARTSRRSCAAPTAPLSPDAATTPGHPGISLEQRHPSAPHPGARAPQAVPPQSCPHLSRGGGRPVGGRNPGALARGGGGNRCPGRQRVNRLTYEMCVLQALRDQLRCKEIWVVGADRYRNPDDDVPQDFAVRPTYYAALKLPSQAEDFIQQVQQEMRDELAALDRTLPRNDDRDSPEGQGLDQALPLGPNPNPPICSPSRWRSPSGGR